MKHINLRTSKSPEELLGAISDNNFVSDGIKFNDKGTRPHMHVKDKGNGKIKIKCEIMGGPSKDNGFLEGTYFKGSVREQDGKTTVKGIVITAPIYHLILLALTIFFIYQCIAVGGISLIPIIMLLFSFFMFRDEYRKQSIIKRYIFRSLKITYARKNPDKLRGKMHNED